MKFQLVNLGSFNPVRYRQFIRMIPTNSVKEIADELGCTRHNITAMFRKMKEIRYKIELLEDNLATLKTLEQEFLVAMEKRNGNRHYHSGSPSVVVRSPSVPL